jgi:hypothetical protein
MAHLVEWDTIEFRLRGQNVNDLAQGFIVPPIETLTLRFMNGLLRIEGTIRKFISVPFSVDIAGILASGTTIRVPVRSASAFGALPIPRFLFGLVKDKLPPDLIRFEEPATFVLTLDRFLPNFTAVDVQKIWIIDGGLAVTLGRGGADLPPDLIGGLKK